MNPDSGAAETPAHPVAMSWRRDLDYKIERWEAREERRLAEEERALKQTHAERLAEQARRQGVGALEDALSRPCGSVEFFPGGGQVRDDRW
jgi:hypothetical protein